MFRPNLRLNVLAASSVNNKVAQMIPHLKKRKGLVPLHFSSARPKIKKLIRSLRPRPAILYVALQRQTEELVNLLKSHGLESQAYHGGMAADARKKVQDDFMSGDKVRRIDRGLDHESGHTGLVVRLTLIRLSFRHRRGSFARRSHLPWGSTGPTSGSLLICTLPKV